MRKFNTLPFLLVMITIVTSCQSGTTKAVRARNEVCSEIPALPPLLDPQEVIQDKNGERYAPTWYTNDLLDHAKGQAECIRQSECALQWRTWESQCGWYRAETLENSWLPGRLSIRLPCTMPEPVCKP